MHRIFLLTLVAVLGAQPLVAEAQDMRLKGSFAPLLAPAADTRPPVGEVRAIVQEDGDVRVDLVVSGLTETARSATVHVGRASEAGEQVARVDVAAQGAEARVIGGTFTLSPAVAERVRAGEGFVLLRTSEHADGLLRAPLVPQARSLDSAMAGD